MPHDECEVMHIRSLSRNYWHSPRKVCHHRDVSTWIIVALVVTVWVTLAVIAALIVGRMVRLRDENEVPGRVDHTPGDRFGRFGR